MPLRIYETKEIGICFGYGDLTSAELKSTNADGSVEYGFSLFEVPPGVVGREVDAAAEQPEPVGIMLLFRNVESVDTVMGWLADLKARFTEPQEPSPEDR